jgi:hypothetical protein
MAILIAGYWLLRTGSRNVPAMMRDRDEHPQLLFTDQVYCDWDRQDRRFILESESVYDSAIRRGGIWAQYLPGRRTSNAPCL